MFSVIISLTLSVAIRIASVQLLNRSLLVYPV